MLKFAIVQHYYNVPSYDVNILCLSCLMSSLKYLRKESFTGPLFRVYSEDSFSPTRKSFHWPPTVHLNKSALLVRPFLLLIERFRKARGLKKEKTSNFVSKTYKANISSRTFRNHHNFKLPVLQNQEALHCIPNQKRNQRTKQEERKRGK